MSYTAKAEIVINAPAAKVWEALVDPSMVKQYLFGTEMSVSAWEVGGQIRYKGSWEGKSYEDKGEILQIIAQQKLVTNYWSSMGGTEDKPENYMKVSYDLAAEGNGTKLTITQENAPTQDSAEHSGENWKMVLDKMKEIVEKSN